MKWFLSAAAIIALLTAGCGSLNIHPSDTSILYHNAQNGFTFCVPASWQGYSVLVERWEGQAYSADKDQLMVTEHGPVIVLRHPHWKASAPYQDIPILVFTRPQWEAVKEGRFSIGAGGLEYEIARNANYVFGIHSRYNADDSVKGWKEADDIVGRNAVANAQRLYPE